MFVVLKIAILWRLFRFQYGTTILKEAFCLFVGYAVSPYPCHLVPQFQSLHIKERVSVVSKLVYLLQVLPAH